MESIRNFIGFSIAAIAAYFNPIQDILSAVLCILVVNFVVGLFAGILVNKEPFSFRKAFYCFIEALVFFSLIAIIFFIGDKIGNKSGALQCISGLTYALMYCYGVNVFRNLKGLFPKSRLIAFIYYVISVEFVDKVPYLKEFLRIEGFSEKNG